MFKEGCCKVLKSDQSSRPESPVLTLAYIQQFCNIKIMKTQQVELELDLGKIRFPNYRVLICKGNRFSVHSTELAPRRKYSSLDHSRISSNSEKEGKDLSSNRSETASSIKTWLGSLSTSRQALWLALATPRRNPP